jgi:acetyl-CoA carboxylase biotin carboxyl carrier protein
MDLNYLKKLIKIFDDSSVTEIRIEEEGIKIKLSKIEENNKPVQLPFAQMAQPQTFPTQKVSTSSTRAEVEEVIKEADKGDDALGGHIVKSPIVGTFYRAPSPDSDPYVEVGDHVIKGTTLCIVEAMKLMNEIESDITGIITKIFIENAQPVDYGKPLFVIKPD